MNEMGVEPIAERRGKGLELRPQRSESLYSKMDDEDIHAVEANLALEDEFYERNAQNTSAGMMDLPEFFRNQS